MPSARDATARGGPLGGLLLRRLNEGFLSSEERQMALLAVYYRCLNGHPEVLQDLSRVRPWKREAERFVRRWGLPAESVSDVTLCVRWARRFGVPPELGYFRVKVGWDSLHRIRFPDLSFDYDLSTSPTEARVKIETMLRRARTSMLRKCRDVESVWYRQGRRQLPARYRNPRGLAEQAERVFGYVTGRGDWKMIAASRGLRDVASVEKNARAFARVAGITVK